MITLLYIKNVNMIYKNGYMERITLYSMRKTGLSHMQIHEKDHTVFTLLNRPIFLSLFNRLGSGTNSKTDMKIGFVCWSTLYKISLHRVSAISKYGLWSWQFEERIYICSKNETIFDSMNEIYIDMIYHSGRCSRDRTVDASPQMISNQILDH